MPKDPAEYMREYRQTLGGQAQMMAQKRRAKARQMAYRKVAQLHRADFERWFAEYLRQVEEQAKTE